MGTRLHGEGCLKSPGSRVNHSPQHFEHARRSVFQIFSAGAVGFSPGSFEAADAAASAPSKWAGRWDDPDAPGCKREIVMNFDGTKGRLTGAESTGMNPGLPQKTCSSCAILFRTFTP